MTFASLLVTACGGGSTTADAGVDAASTLSCPEIFDCISACSDSACEDACIERGTPDGISLATALAVCADANSCTTEECLSTSCADEVLACAAVAPTPDGGLPDGGLADGGLADGGIPACTAGGVGVPELTGVGGLSASYVGGEPITVTLLVDEDTRRATVTLYEYGSPLMLGSVATEVSSTTATLSLPAGTDAAPPGTYYLQVELCSTSLCTSPLSRTSYDRVADDTSYTETRIQPGVTTESCASGIPITTFQID